jgi:hypothetical protein
VGEYELAKCSRLLHSWPSLATLQGGQLRFGDEMVCWPIKVYAEFGQLWTGGTLINES